MSAPTRGAGTSRVRSSTATSARGRGGRGTSRASQLRGRGGGSLTPSTTNPKAEGLLEGLRSGNLKRGSNNALIRAARGRGSTARGTAAATRGQLTGNARISAKLTTGPAAPKPQDLKSIASDYMAEATARFENLKRNRETERTRAIKDGFLADPEKKTTLDNAITPVGTCTEMCPAFERVERIVQRMVDKSEKDQNDSSRPDESRMVKRFRRSAAGYDEQLPSDIRTPTTLKKTLDYLLDDIVGGGERLASIHKFVWDRTRGIRNDFSIQQVTQKDDVRLAVECLERIARFHILSLHQLSNPENLIGEQFDAHQDREQLNNTLLSLMYYYDDNRHVLEFPNEPEFRAYCIIFELQSQHPDIEDRMQSWPETLLLDGRVRTAFKLYAAAGNNVFDQGPLRPLTPFSIAQANTGSFWNILASKQVSYLMACVAEIYFGQVRYVALQALWSAATNAPVSQRAKNQEWTLEELTNVLGFDAEEQATEFCQAFELEIASKDDGTQYLDVSQNKTLDKSSIPTKQEFSYGIVEAKRYRRTLAAVINGKTVAQALREGLVEADDDQNGAMEDEGEPVDEGDSLFFPEHKTISANPFAKPAVADANPFTKSALSDANPFAQPVLAGFNSQAPAFQPGVFQPVQVSSTSQPEASANPFAKAVNSFRPTTTSEPAQTNPFANGPSLFPAPQTKIDSPTIASKSANPFAKSNTFTFTPQSTPPKPTSQPFVFNSGGFPVVATSTPPINSNLSIPLTTTNSFSFFTSQPISPPTTQTLVPPATFSFPPTTTQENTQSSVGHPASVPEFHISPNITTPVATTRPPGMITSQQEWQPASPTIKDPPPPLSLDPVLLELTPDPVSSDQALRNSRSFAPVKFSAAPNGPVTAFDQPARTWPRQFPSNSILQFMNSPQNVATPPSDGPRSSSSRPIVADPNLNNSGSTPPASSHVQAQKPSADATTGSQPLSPPDFTQQGNSTPKGPVSRKTRSTPISPLSNEILPDLEASKSTKTRSTNVGSRSKSPTSSLLSQVLSPSSSGVTKPSIPGASPYPSKPLITKSEIVDTIARVAMTSTVKKGFVQEFTEQVAVQIIHEAIQQHLDEVHAAEAEIERVANINRTEDLISRRERRRADFAKIARNYEEEEKKRVQEVAEKIEIAEREQILAEVEESAKIQAQIKGNLAKDEEHRKAKAAKQRKAKEAKEEKAESKTRLGHGRLARRKRKSDVSDTTDEARFDFTGRPITPHHKRSRTESTIDTELDSEDGYERHKVRYLNMPKSPGRSMFSNKPSSYGVRLASDPPSRKIDNTKTDYFRLMAYGVDPDTPIVPLTAVQVEYRRQQEELHKAQLAAEPKPYQGNHLWDRQKNGYPPINQLPEIKNFQMPKSEFASARPPPSIEPKQPKPDKDAINDLLRQLAKVRKQQDAQTDWLKDQIDQLQDESDVNDGHNDVDLDGADADAGLARGGTSREDAIELDSD